METMVYSCPECGASYDVGELLDSMEIGYCERDTRILYIRIWDNGRKICPECEIAKNREIELELDPLFN